MGKVIKKEIESDKDKELHKTRKSKSVTHTRLRPASPKFQDLPLELLIHIFSFLPQHELFETIRVVCPEFSLAASHSCLWESIRVGPEIAIEELLNWLENAPNLRFLEINSRLDAAVILRKVVRCNRRLEDIKIHRCWGTPRQVNLPSDALCKLLLRCPNLHSISLTGSRFVSCKFFRLLATKDSLTTRPLTSKFRRTGTVCFSGNATLKQLKVFLNARKMIESSRLAFLSVENAGREQAMSFSNEIIAENEEDLERILEALEAID